MAAVYPSAPMTIRRQPADFLVIERPSAAFLAAMLAGREGAATHAVYELTKESLGTPEAVGMFAKQVGARGGTVDYAGLKDKHARTTQLVSVMMESGEPPTQVGGAGGRAWSARMIGWSERSVTAAEIDGNRFEIVVRDLSKQQSTEMGMRAGRLEIASGEECSGVAPKTRAGKPVPPEGEGTRAGKPVAREGEDTRAGKPVPRDTGGTPVPRNLLVLNYFGAQRFGSARHGAGFVAPRLMRGDFEGALKLAIGTPARKDTGKTREFSRMCATHWGAWKKLAAELPRCPEGRAVEALAAGGSFAKAFENLPNFTQQMCVEAYQSHLWNATARRLAEQMAAEFTDRWQREGGEEATRKTAFRPVAPLRADDEFGVMLFPTARMVDAAWMGVVMPVLGPKSELREPWGAAAAAVLAEEGIKLEDLKIPGMRRPYFGEADRPLFVEAEGFEMTDPERDELSAGGKRVKRTVRFSLGRGAYATVVLRAMGQ